MKKTSPSLSFKWYYLLAIFLGVLSFTIVNYLDAPCGWGYIHCWGSLIGGVIEILTFYLSLLISFISFLFVLVKKFLLKKKTSLAWEIMILSALFAASYVIASYIF